MSKLKNRIAVDARFMLRPLRGMPLYVTRLCQSLPSLNKDLLFYFFINKAYEHNDLPENYQQRLDEITGNHDNVRVINRDDEAEIRWEQIYLPLLIKEHGIDLLHMPGNRICFFSPVPVIVTVHDVMEYLYLKEGYFKILTAGNADVPMILYRIRKCAYNWANYRFGFRKAQRVITVSRHSAGDIVNHLKIAPGKVIPIHHGLDNDFRKDLLVHSENHSDFLTRKYVLMLGGDSYQKNPAGAIAAWATVPKAIRDEHPLKIVGFCGNDDSSLIQALQKYNLLHEVEIKGWVSQDSLRDYLRNASLFLYLSRYEGFGFPLLHAMASGTPVISTNRSSLPEVLGDVGLLFDPDDHRGIAGGIERILLDHALWKEQSMAGLKRAQLFDWRTSAEEHLRVYKEVLEG